MKTILFAGKDCFGNWQYGSLLHSEGDENYFIHNSICQVKVDPETVCQFTGKHMAKGNKVFNGTIAFTEVEEDEGDRRIYVVCVWIEEWSMFAFLTVEEYKNYLENGFESIDEPMFWTYNLQDSEKYHYAGNIFDNPELLNS